MILRSYMCDSCGFSTEVELRADQWDAPAPECPHCDLETMGQRFKPPAIGGSNLSRAAKMAEQIARQDYNVADMKLDARGGANKVRYREGAGVPPSTWSAPNANLAQAVALGRESRLRYGSGLDVLQSTLKDGTMPDLIALSKTRSARVW